MVDKGIVLLAVEHLQQRGGRIALVVRAELVDLVEDQQRIARAALSKRIDDTSGHRGDVGAAVTADLGFIPYAAQGDAVAFSADGFADRGRDRGLADTGRSDKADDLSLGFVAQFAHGELFDDTLLDFIETVVIGVELFTHQIEVDVLLCHGVPRQLHDGVYVGLDHAGFVGTDRQAFQTRAFLHQRLFDLFGELHLGDLAPQLVDIVEVAVLTQLVTDHVHLLAQVVIALALVDTGLRLLHDILLDRHDEDLVLHRVDQHLEPVGKVDGLEDDLLDLYVEDDIGRNEIGEFARFVGHADLEEDIGRQLRGQLHIALKGRLERTHQRDIAGRQRMLTAVAVRLDRCVQTAVAGNRFDDRSSPQTLDHDARRLLILFDDLFDAAYHADLIDIVDRRFVHAGVHLSGNEDQLIAVHRHLDGAFGTLAVHIKVQHHLREHDNAPKRQNR